MLFSLHVHAAFRWLVRCCWELHFPLDCLPICWMQVWNLCRACGLGMGLINQLHNYDETQSFAQYAFGVLSLNTNSCSIVFMYPLSTQTCHQLQQQIKPKKSNKNFMPCIIVCLAGRFLLVSYVADRFFGGSIYKRYRQLTNQITDACYTPNTFTAIFFSPQYVCSAQPQTSHWELLIHCYHQTVQLSSHPLEWG